MAQSRHWQSEFAVTHNAALRTRTRPNSGFAENLDIKLEDRVLSRYLSFDGMAAFDIERRSRTIRCNDDSWGEMLA
jgi:hypothetical protein